MGTEVPLKSHVCDAGRTGLMNMPTTLGVGGLEVTTTIQHQTPRLGIRTGKRFRFFTQNCCFWLGRRALLTPISLILIILTLVFRSGGYELNGVGQDGDRYLQTQADGSRPMCRGDRWCVVHTYKQNSGDSAAARSETHMIFIKFHIFGVFFH